MTKRKFNPQRFRALVERKIHEKGYTGVDGFTKSHDFPRNSLARAVIGTSKPTPESLNRWSDALQLTPDERTELYHSVGLLTPEEQEQESEEPANMVAA